MIDDILDFMRLAGDIARGAQNHLDASANYLKAESVTSVVTAADLEISQLFRQFVARRFADTDYVIIDEESLNTLGEDKWQRINQAEYQFIIDPIDGTLPYSCSQALYGISVGIFRRGNPAAAHYICRRPVNSPVLTARKSAWCVKLFSRKKKPRSCSRRFAVPAR